MLITNGVFFDWDDFVTCSAVIKKTVTGCVFIAILFLMYWFDIRHQQYLFAKQKQQTIALQEQIVQKELQVQGLASQQAEWQSMQEEFDVLLQQLPKNNDIPELVEYISHVGIANGLLLESIEMQPEEDNDFYVAVPINLAIKGNYQQLVKFIGEISNLPQLVTTHDFLIKNPATTGKDNLLNITLTIKTYIYNDQKTDKMPETNDSNEYVLTENPRSPFAPTAVVDLSEKPNILENFSLEKIRMVGSLKKKDDIIAILVTENQAFYPVAIGDTIGKNRGEVVAINDNQMEVEEKFLDGLDGRKPLRILLEVQNRDLDVKQ